MDVGNATPQGSNLLREANTYLGKPQSVSTLNVKTTMAFVPCIPVNHLTCRSTSYISSAGQLHRKNTQKNRGRCRPVEPICCSPTPIPSPSQSTTCAVQKMREKIEELAGSTRGIFGLPEEEREAIGELIKACEKEDATAKPTANNAIAADGKWRLIYTTLEILGRRRVKLAVSTPRKSGFVKLGEFYQVVNASTKQTSNIVHFNVLEKTYGTFTIDADYVIETEKRVMVKVQKTWLFPESLRKLLGDNEKLLSDIFDPTGFLDITYVDSCVRIGRDGKGQVFVLEKVLSK